MAVPIDSIDPSALVQEVELGENDLKFKAPFVLCVSGATMSGKSEFILNLITHRHEMFDVKFDQIIYCEPERLVLRPNPIFDRLKQACPSAQLVIGLPDISKLNLDLDTRHKLVVIDDLMEPFLNSQAMVQLLSIDCHHSNISTIYTVQNFFAQSRFRKTLSKNVNYRCLFFNRLDLTEIRMISMQICHQPKFLLECFEFLQKEFPHSPPYIIIDGHNQSRLKKLFIRSQILPNEKNEITPIFFFPNAT